MFVLRLIGLLLIIAFGASIAVYLFTRDRRYIRFAGQLAKYAIVLAIIALLFMLFERLVMVV